MSLSSLNVFRYLRRRAYSSVSYSRTNDPFTANTGITAGFLDSPYFWSEDSDEPLKDFVARNEVGSTVNEDNPRGSVWIKKGSLYDSRHDFRTAAAIAMPKATTAWIRMKHVGHFARLETPIVNIGYHRIINFDGSKEKMRQLRLKNWISMRRLARKHGYTSGCWVIKPPELEEYRDSWARLAESLISGALRQTSAFMLHAVRRDATVTQRNNQKYYILVHMPDIYDEPAVEKIARILDYEGHFYHDHPPPFAQTDMVSELGRGGNYGNRSFMKTAIWHYADKGIRRPL
ncbi:hypothetical protein Moror_10062 [Moniliophthora roreri MCA 2997]|uniref:Uncharacterized protein n=2 Tax=Moniliophthora roreri TaxID=221103 RepID=V2WFB1_MONRO|nr:hypothetical protein Moror_10062 [Moniliophthora roreri MCA 2997]